METRIRYIVVGAFTLAVAAAAIFFVLWIGHSGSLAPTRSVLVTFEGSAPGLRAGESVTFNGVRVGEVTAVKFDPRDPKVVRAHLAVDARAPLNGSTSVSLDSQGLMGTVTVALVGGVAGRPARTIDGGTIVYVAPGARSLTEQAQATLADLRKLAQENAKPLRETIVNLQSFSGVLAKNSGRIDHILAGLDKLAGGGEKKPKGPLGDFDLKAPAAVSGLSQTKPTQLVIADPTSVVALDTQRFLSRNADGLLAIETAQWSDTIPKLIQKKLIETFANAGYRYASPPTDGLRPDFQLLLDIRAFETRETKGALDAFVEFGARLVGADGKVVSARVFSGQSPASGSDGGPAAAAMNKAFAEAARKLVLWCAKAVVTTPAANKPAARSSGPPVPVPQSGP